MSLQMECLICGYVGPDGHHSCEEYNADKYARLQSRLAECERELANEKARGIHSCWAECPRPLCVATRENDKLKAELAALREVVEKAPHNNDCASLKPGFMVGGVSFDVNVRPDAHEVKHECDCWKRDALGR